MAASTSASLCGSTRLMESTLSLYSSVPGSRFLQASKDC